jgi:hypothetical protein
MTIISNAELLEELPTGATTTKVTRAVNESSGLVNTWCVKYEQWPDHDDTQTPPYEIKRSCLEVAKALYYLSIGQVNRDGNENETWQDVLDFYKIYLETIEVEPTQYSVTISLDSNGVQLIGRNVNILRYHNKKCYVTSVAAPTTTIWNQGVHWDIRKGNDSDNEFLDGWYFDAETYEDTIEGTLYYVRSWRNDGLDYQKWWPQKLS